MLGSAGFAVGAGVALAAVRRRWKAQTAARALCTLADVTLCSKVLVLKGPVAKGFGRGGKLLNCPTANIDDAAVGDALDTFENGVYFGWAKLDGKVYKMVTSIGWNPYFKNDKKTVEPHILHKFDEDFYGKEISIVVCGRIRPELDFDSLEALVEAIENDKEIATQALEDEAYAPFKDQLL